MAACRAVRLHRFGGPEQLRVEEIERPIPRDDEVVIRVEAASVNPVDLKIRAGTVPMARAEQLPIVLGRDASGVVETCGTAAHTLRAGDAVFCSVGWDRGTYAELLLVKAVEMTAKPARLDHVRAAAVPLAGLTAWQGLLDHGGLEPGQRVLVHGGAGGVGHFAIQIAKAKGAWVAATVSDRDVGFARELGADEVIDYRHQRFERAARDIDLVLDLIGGETQERSWSVLRPGGIIVSTVQEPDQDTARERQARGARFLVEPNAAQLEQIAHLIDTDKIRPSVAAVFPLDQVRDAHRALEQAHPRGKIVLRIGQ
ncbi:MAG TPA: NADP-dependent oxidoreductase [Acetobacteraceae bacterium]|nr:NADP-dependent oxidoreductase [Acetobacteraceae bacterium]